MSAGLAKRFVDAMFGHLCDRLCKEKKEALEPGMEPTPIEEGESPFVFILKDKPAIEALLLAVEEGYPGDGHTHGYRRTTAQALRDRYVDEDTGAVGVGLLGGTYPLSIIPKDQW